MEQIAYLAAVAIAVALGLLLWRRSRRRHAVYDAARLVQEAWPAWAVQGPFISGEESARAMLRAFLAVLARTADLQGFLRLASTCDEHAQAFDSDPKKWEEVRGAALEHVSATTAQLAEVIPMWASSPERLGSGAASAAFLAGAIFGAGFDAEQYVTMFRAWRDHWRQYDAAPDDWERLRAAVRADFPLTEEQNARRRQGLRLAKELLQLPPDRGKS